MTAVAQALKILEGYTFVPRDPIARAEVLAAFAVLRASISEGNDTND